MRDTPTQSVPKWMDLGRFGMGHLMTMHKACTGVFVMLDRGGYFLGKSFQKLHTQSCAHLQTHPSQPPLPSSQLWPFPGFYTSGS